MKPILKSNLYFLFILIISIFAPSFTTPLLIGLGLNIPLTLVMNHIIIFIVPAITYIVIAKANTKNILKLNKLKFKDILIAIVMAIVAQPIMVFLSYLSSLFFTNDVSFFMESTKNYPTWLMLIVVAVTPAITEEITMRGIVLSGYNYKNSNVAAIMTGFMFGLMHLNPQQFLYAFAVGIIFAYMVRATGSIFISMITHFMINGTQLLMQRVTSVNVSKEELMSQMEAMQNLSLYEKLIPLGIYFIFTLMSILVIRYLLRVLEKRNMNIFIDDLRVETKIEYKHENPVNIPFILSVVVYILYIIYRYILINL